MILPHEAAQRRARRLTAAAVAIGVAVLFGASFGPEALGMVLDLPDYEVAALARGTVAGACVLAAFAAAGMLAWAAVHWKEL